MRQIWRLQKLKSQLPEELRDELSDEDLLGASTLAKMKEDEEAEAEAEEEAEVKKKSKLKSR